MDLYDSSEDEEYEIGHIRQEKVYRERVNYFNFYAKDFKERFRLRPSEMEFLFSKIGEYLQHPSSKNQALTPQQQLLTALHWLGTGCQYHALGDMHGVSKSTVCRALYRVVDLINEHMAPNLITWPEDCSTLALDFLEVGGFPSVCGAVDGTMINIDAPRIHEEQYVDRHGDHSLNVMCICGPDYKIYYVNARFPGSSHDSRVLKASQISAKFNSGWRPFPGAVLLGDSAYGLKSWLIPPLHQNPDDPAEQRFNVAHKCTRRIIENTYGIVKKRFPCLKYLRLEPEYAAKVFIACATLHNIARAKDFFDDKVPLQEEQDPEEEEVDNAGRAKVQELLHFFQ